MPDVSLLEPLCSELNISINELLNGERLKNEYTDHLTAETLINYNRFLIRKEKRKSPILLITMLGILIPCLALVVLCLNKTFFKTTYCSDFADGVTIPIPRFSYYRLTGGLDTYTTTLKTLKQPDDVSVFIDDYLRSLEKCEVNDRIYYYDQENNFTILTYTINNDGPGFMNTIYLTYKKGDLRDTTN